MLIQASVSNGNVFILYIKIKTFVNKQWLKMIFSPFNIVYWMKSSLEWPVSLKGAVQQKRLILTYLLFIVCVK